MTEMLCLLATRWKFIKLATMYKAENGHSFFSLHYSFLIPLPTEIVIAILLDIIYACTIESSSSLFFIHVPFV